MDTKQSDIGRWIDARCILDENARSYSSELYQDFLEFLGYRTLLERARAGKTHKAFTQALVRNYPCVVQKSNRSRIVGIRFITRREDNDL